MAFMLALFLGSFLHAEGSYVLQYSENAEGVREFIRLRHSRETEDDIKERTFPRFIIEHGKQTQDKMIEISGPSKEAIEKILHQRSVRERAIAPPAADEVVTLVSGGDPKNRIDLVFMGDGYTQSEKNLFLDDVRRLVKDMFEGPTFRSYLPLFNVHAVFRASVESGIGKNDTPKNTAYRLYRVGDTLRAIMPGDVSAAMSSCGKAPECDYAIVVANDPYYGGLGGELAITTRSLTSGTKVLRHELGHNFGRVGEEYDGGEETFFGKNYSSSLSSIGWKHWFDGSGQAEPAIAYFVGWPWKNLKNGAVKFPFKSSGTWSSGLVEFSASGLETDKDLVITLDGDSIPFKSPGSPDRVHFSQTLTPFGGGNHELSFSTSTQDGNTYLSSATIHEFGSGYHFQKHYVGAFPLFDQNSRLAGYRSTHDTCVMRNMNSGEFCKVCQENNWMQFLAQVGLADEVKVERVGGKVKVEVLFPKLGQFRVGGALPGESLSIRWLKNGQEDTSLSNEPLWERDETQAKGSWSVVVSYATTEVRKDPKGLLTTKKTFSL